MKFVSRNQRSNLPQHSMTSTSAVVGEKPHVSASIVSRPLKPALKATRKSDIFSKQKISPARAMREPRKHLYKSHTYRRKHGKGLERKIEWYNDFEEQLEQNATTLLQESTSSLTDIHHKLSNELTNDQIRLATGIQNLAHEVGVIFNPLWSCQIETTDKTKGNVTHTGVSSISTRIDLFKQHLAAYEDEFTAAWKDFDEIQAQLIVLGRDILGENAIVGIDEAAEGIIKGNRSKQSNDMTFKRTMEAWDLELNVELIELKADVSDIETQFEKKIGKMDKDLDKLEESEKRQLLLSLST